MVMQHALLIHNDGAGDAKIHGDALAKVLEASGVSVRHCAPDAPNLAASLAGAEDLVIVAGGDGTVALVPLGTANNIAQSLGILSSVDPGAGEEILTAWRNADHRMLDIGIADGPWGRERFVEGVGIGPLARTIIQFKSKGVSAVDGMRLGREAFAHAIGQCAPLQSRIRIDEADLQEEILMLEVMNIQLAGSRVRLAPNADTGDGLFDVVTLNTAQRLDFLDWLKSNSDKEEPPVTWRRAHSVNLDWRGEPLRIDDHSPKMDRSEGEVSIRFATQKLDILVPSWRDKAATETAPEPARKEVAWR